MAFGDLVNNIALDRVNSNGASPLTLTFNASPTAGNLGVLVTRGWVSLSTPTGWTLATTCQDTTGSLGAIFYRVMDGTETSVDVEDGDYGGIYGIYSEYAGPFSASPLDVVSSEVEASAASVTTQPGAIATTVASSVVLLWGVNNSNSTSTGTTVSDAFTVDEQNIQAPSAGDGFGILAHKVLAETATLNPTITWPLAVKGVAAIAAFKAQVANSDPVLDSPIADLSIPANTSGVIADVSSHFSDVDGDSLTYGVSPALPSGMTLNTTTGQITGNGSIAQTAAANYTFTADDGQGGTPASDVVSIEVTAPAFVIDSHDASMQRVVDWQLTCSNPAVVPTPENSNITSGNDVIPCTGVTGTNPYTLTFAVGDLSKQADATGYAWTLAVGAQNQVTGNVPLNVQAGWGVQPQVDPVTTEGSVWYQSTGDTPATGWHVEHELVTSPDNIAVTITETGGINLASVPTRNQTFQFRAVEPDGTISNTETFTWQEVVAADLTPDQMDLGVDVIGLEPGAQVQRSFFIAGIDAGETVNIQALGMATLSASTGQLGDEITVTLTASNSLGQSASGGVEINGVSDSVSLTTRAAVVPAVTTQPTNQTVEEGQAASFSCAFSNAVSIQWYRDGQPVNGETGTSLSLSTVLGDNGATFYAIGTSADNETVQTNTATLTVNEVVVVTAPTMPADTSATVQEGTTAVGTYVASSGDAPITYSLSGTDSSSFTINSTTGVLAFVSAPDYETKNSYAVTVVATNSAGSDSQAVAVSITNIAEQAPNINTGGTTSITITEGATYSDPAWTWDDDVVSGQAVTWPAATVDSNTAPGTYTRTATATNSVGTTNVTYTITVVSAASFVDAGEILRVTRGKPVIHIHDGESIPTTDPIDTDGHVWKQFNLDNLADGETLIGTPTVLINEVAVSIGESVEGMTFQEIQTDGSSRVKVRIQGGEKGKLYVLTIRYSATYTPSNDRSQQFYALDL